MIKVAEVFYSIQGEGISRGKPAVFIRMPHCNLQCEGKDWKCDSLEFRNKYESYTPGGLWDKIFSLNPNLEDYLEEGRAIIIYTGGEPGMVANSRMLNEFEMNSPFYFTSEIETNGSVEMNEEYRRLLSSADVINCSPKLESSGNPLNLRFNKKTLEHINGEVYSYFKFVVNDIKDIQEVEERFDFIKPEKIILMPATHNIHDKNEEDQNWKQYVWDIATEKGWMYSGREHIDVWGMRAGV